VLICSNDAFDSSTGVDSNASKPESIVNLIGGNWRLVLAASALALAAGVRLLAKHVLATGSAVPGYMLLAAICCGYVYQGPPFR